MQRPAILDPYPAAVVAVPGLEAATSRARVSFPYQKFRGHPLVDIKRSFGFLQILRCAL